MKSFDIIHGEHRALGAVLQALQFVLGEIRAARLAPDFGLLSAMVRYISEVPEKVHHPKEDHYLFTMLRARSQTAAKLIDELEQQHATGSRMTAELSQALERYRQQGQDAFADFDALCARYLDFNRQHLKLEETQLLPLARQALREDDWAEIDSAFAANFDPYADAAGEFHALFARIVNLTPAPYGLGPPA